MAHHPLLLEPSQATAMGAGHRLSQASQPQPAFPSAFPAASWLPWVWSDPKRFYKPSSPLSYTG